MIDAYNHARDLRKGETMRNRDAVSYAEHRAIKKEAKINARLEARKLKREQIFAERKRLRGLEKTAANENKWKNLKTVGIRVFQLVVGIAALDSAVSWTAFAFASF
ncbi:hypothetical protein [Rhizobium giardinii]|uniref:hypothetical protein n=1 Tax=Rhizobium giardinii TaxID=56731 RepID=UPI003D6ED09B